MKYIYLSAPVYEIMLDFLGFHMKVNFLYKIHTIL